MKLGPLKVGRRPLKQRTKLPGDAPTFAVRHPIKLEALIALHERPQNAAEIAARLGEDVRNVTNHLRQLYDAGCIEFAGHEGDGNFKKGIYRAIARPLINDETFGAMSDEERHAATAVVMQWILAESLSSFRNRKMDRDDGVVLITDEPTLDSVGIRETRELMTDTYAKRELEAHDTRDALISIQEIEGRAANRMTESGEEGTTMVIALGGRDARDRPCLEVLIAQPIAVEYEASQFEVCGAVTSVPTLINFSIGQGKAERTVIAMAVGVNVRRVLVNLGSRGRRRIRPKLLPVKVAKKLDLERFRFAVIPLVGPHCLRRILGTEADGEVVVDKSYRDCAA